MRTSSFKHGVSLKTVGVERKILNDFSDRQVGVHKSRVSRGVLRVHSVV